MEKKKLCSQSQKLLNDDRSDLDVEIEVLRERLAREGVRLANSNEGTDI